MSVKPGWYKDPAGSGLLRYFDGTNWTPQTKPVPGTEAPATGPSLAAGSVTLSDYAAPTLADGDPVLPAEAPSTLPDQPPAEWSGWDTNAANIEETIIEDNSADGFAKVTGKGASNFKLPLIIGAGVLLAIAAIVVGLSIFGERSPDAGQVTATPSPSVQPSDPATATPETPLPTAPPTTEPTTEPTAEPTTEPTVAPPTDTPATPSATTEPTSAPTPSPTVTGPVIDEKDTAPAAGKAVTLALAKWIDEQRGSDGIVPDPLTLAEAVSTGKAPNTLGWQIGYLNEGTEFCLQVTSSVDPKNTFGVDSRAGLKVQTGQVCTFPEAGAPKP